MVGMGWWLYQSIPGGQKGNNLKILWNFHHAFLIVQSRNGKWLCTCIAPYHVHSSPKHFTLQSFTHTLTCLCVWWCNGGWWWVMVASHWKIATADLVAVAAMHWRHRALWPSPEGKVGEVSAKFKNARKNDWSGLWICEVYSDWVLLLPHIFLLNIQSASWKKESVFLLFGCKTTVIDTKNKLHYFYSGVDNCCWCLPKRHK